MQREFEVQFASTNMIFMLESWWWPLTTMGWGAWRLDFGQAKQGMIFIDIFESAVAKSLGNVGHVVCHFYAGQFAGAFSYFAKRDLACIEVQCYAMGEEYCKFLVSSSKRVNAVSFWRNEGASPKDILGKLAAADSEDG
jgi:predicted hydrocarbon binding protein